MLSSMRSGKNQTVVWILLGLLILGLTGFGINGLSGGNIRSIGAVGDEPVPVNVYARSLQNAVQTASRQVGRNLTPAEIEGLGLTRQVLNTVLASSALDNEASKLGISVGDEAVARDVRATPSFQGLDGSFDKEAYEFALERAGLSARENEELIRKTASRNLLQAAIATGNTGSANQARLLLDFAREARAFDWVELTADMLPAPVGTPTDAQLTEQYDATPEAYTTPETRNITYAWLKPEMLDDKVSVDEDQLRESYELQSDRFNRGAQLDIDRIIFGSTDDATEALGRIESGDVDFDGILSERNLEPEDVALGQVTAGGIAKTASELLFAQTDPGVYGPVESSLGPALFRINAVIAAQETTFEEAREELFAELAGEDARRMVNDMFVDFEDLLAAGATLEELANDTDMQLGTIALNADSDEEIAGYDAFRSIAASVEEGDFPELNTLSDGGIFALRLDSVTEPTLQPLEAVRAQVTQDWTAAESLRLLEAEAERLKAEIEGDATFETVGLQATSATDVTRDSFLENVPLSLVSNVFELKDDDAVAIANGTNSVFLAQLTGSTPFDPIEPSNAVLLEQVNAQLAQQRSSDMLALFSQGVQTEAGVSLNQAAINSINSQVLLQP